MIHARIAGTGRFVCGEQVPTEAVAERAQNTLDGAEVRKRTGIDTRYWAPAGTELWTMGVEALRPALTAANVVATDLERVIFVSSTGGDRLIPATANLVANAVGADRNCDAFDLNNACTGFLTALDVAARSVATGSGPVAIVCAERFAPYIGPEDPRPYAVMGDAAAAAVVVPDNSGGLRASVLRNDGGHATDIDMLHPMHSGRPARLRFHASNRSIGGAAIPAIVEAAKHALERAGLTVEDIAALVPHQPNGPMLDAIAVQLGIPPDKVTRVVEEIGSVGAASLPYGLDAMVRGRTVQPGENWLMVAVGAGMSYGALVYQVPA